MLKRSLQLLFYLTVILVVGCTGVPTPKIILDDLDEVKSLTEEEIKENEDLITEIKIREEILKKRKVPERELRIKFVRVDKAEIADEIKDTKLKPVYDQFKSSEKEIVEILERVAWPPEDGEPMVTLVGPFYEAGRETKVPLFKALEKAMTEIVENQQTHLPEFYQKRISGMNHQLFRPGYSNDEEWGSIKSLSSKAENYDTERIAGILESSENRKPGLEMAIRMQPTIETQPASVTLEGYRLVLQPSGKGQAEWFTEEVKLTGREAEDAFRKTLVWLLAKPFAQAQKSFVLKNNKVPFWKDKNNAGVLTFAKREFTADPEPVRKETVSACVQTRLCPEMNVKGDEFVIVSNFRDAKKICSIFDRELIDKETLLRLSLTEEGSNLLDEENGAAWHSGGESGYFEENYNHHDITVEKTQSGVVWCRSPVRDTYNFHPRPGNFVIDRGWRTIKLYKSTLYGRALRILDGELVVESLYNDELYPRVMHGRILDNSFSDAASQGDIVSVSAPQSGFVFGISYERYPIDVTFYGTGWERSIEAPVWRLGGSIGTMVKTNELGLQFSLGFSKPGFSLGYLDDKGSTTINGEIGGHFLAGLWGYLKLLPNIRWHSNFGIEVLVLSSSAADINNLFFLNADVRLHYQWQKFELSVGMLGHTGARGNFEQGCTQKTEGTSEFDRSCATHASLVDSVSIPTGVTTLLGIQYDFF